jgi:hypothetical protein
MLGFCCARWKARLAMLPGSLVASRVALLVALRLRGQPPRSDPDWG